MIFEEIAENLNVPSPTFLSVKLPVYINNKIAGLLGCSLPIGMQGCTSLSCFLTTLIKMELINHSKQLPGFEFENYYFSKRENEILHYTVRGKTAKQIGRIFKISFRTVERHIENIKIRTNIHNKSELIEKFFDRFAS